MSDHYVCPCPDGCNGCEVPDFAIKEIERLTFIVARQTEANSDLHDRIAELEAEVKALWLEKIKRDNIANREIET